ncbi:MAG: tetratricopeptide repeat protein [Candidatus Thorarchaeota archaeon]|jgi:tetratricopeptide (TPR) repeat protein
MGEDTFFDDPNILILRSLESRAQEQVGLMPEHGGAVNQYRWNPVLEERMMMLLPFHNVLFKLLDRDPHTLRGKELDKITKECKKNIATTPDDRDSWLLWASAHAYANKMTEAEDVLRKALSHDRDFPDAWFMIGALLYGFGRIQDASSSIAQSLELDPSNMLLQKYQKYIDNKAQLADYTLSLPKTTDRKKLVNNGLNLCGFCAGVYLAVIFQVLIGTLMGYYGVSPDATIFDFLGTIIGIIGLGGFLVWWVIIKRRNL